MTEHTMTEEEQLAEKLAQESFRIFYKSPFSPWEKQGEEAQAKWLAFLAKVRELLAPENALRQEWMRQQAEQEERLLEIAKRTEALKEKYRQPGDALFRIAYHGLGMVGRPTVDEIVAAAADACRARDTLAEVVGLPAGVSWEQCRAARKAKGGQPAPVRMWRCAGCNHMESGPADRTPSGPCPRCRNTCWSERENAPESQPTPDAAEVTTGASDEDVILQTANSEFAIGFGLKISRDSEQWRLVMCAIKMDIRSSVRVNMARVVEAERKRGEAEINSIKADRDGWKESSDVRRWLCIPLGLLALPYRGACWVVKRYGVRCAPDELAKQRWVERVGGIRPRGT